MPRDRASNCWATSATSSLIRRMMVAASRSFVSTYGVSCCRNWTRHDSNVASASSWPPTRPIRLTVAFCPSRADATLRLT